MVFNINVIFFGVLSLIHFGSPWTFDEKVFCYNAQIQDVFLVYSDLILATSLRIKTINDTTGVRQRFHFDYLHPKTAEWTTYQEDRQSKAYYLPSPHAKGWTEMVLRDPFIARYFRVSLQLGESLSWLGELCANIELKVTKARKSSCSAGSHGDGKYCSDINECADTTGNFCPRKQHCNDYPGKYHCPGTCIGDYIANRKNKVCKDLCFHRGFVCDQNAQCVNGRCVCDEGYKGDGIYCFDHCITKELTCHPNANCIEDDCSCRSGYKGNGEICQAICHSGNILCHPDAACEHNVCKCKAGFVGDGLSKCVFSRVRYEKAKKEELASGPHLDVVETDVFEVLHTFQRLRTVLNEE